MTSERSRGPISSVAFLFRSADDLKLTIVFLGGAVGGTTRADGPAGLSLIADMERRGGGDEALTAACVVLVLPALMARSLTGAAVVRADEIG